MWIIQQPLLLSNYFTSFSSHKISSNIYSIAMLRYFCMFCFLFLFTDFSFGQIEVDKVVDHELSAGLDLPNNSGNFTDSMNNYIAVQENILSHKDPQYMAFYKKEPKVAVGRRNVCAGSWEFVRVMEWFIWP